MTQKTILYSVLISHKMLALLLLYYLALLKDFLVFILTKLGSIKKEGPIKYISCLCKSKLHSKKLKVQTCLIIPHTHYC